MTRCRLLLLLCVCGTLLTGCPGSRVLAEEVPGNSSNTGAHFLRSVIRRMEGKPEEDEAAVEDLAKPVADLKAALERVSGSMAAAGMDMAPADPTAQLPSDVSADPGPPYVFAPTAEASPVASGSAPLAYTPYPPYPPSAPAPINAPPLDKDELSALYQAVADKGLLLDLASIKGGYLPPGQGGELAAQASQQVAPGEQQAGYYYYFLPIKGVSDQKAQPLQQSAPPQPAEGDPAPGTEHDAVMSIMNALGADMNNVMGAADSQKSVEPLFMAMAGFIGMALMFVMSVLFLPKWGALRSRGVTALKHAPDELASLTKLVVQSIEGKDCSERIACEVGRAVRTMRLGNKPLRVLEIILPPNLSKQIGHIRKAARKAEKCNFIPCKYPASFSHPFKPYIPGKPLMNKLPPAASSTSASSAKPPVMRAASTRSTTSSTSAYTTPRSKPLPHAKTQPHVKPMRIKLFTGNNNNNKNHSNNVRNNNKPGQNNAQRRVGSRTGRSTPAVPHPAR